MTRKGILPRDEKAYSRSDMVLASKVYNKLRAVIRSQDSIQEEYPLDVNKMPSNFREKSAIHFYSADFSARTPGFGSARCTGITKSRYNFTFCPGSLFAGMIEDGKSPTYTIIHPDSVSESSQERRQDNNRKLPPYVFVDPVKLGRELQSGLKARKRTGAAQPAISPEQAKDLTARLKAQGKIL